MGLIENLKRTALEKEIEREAHHVNENFNGELDHHRRQYELLQNEYLATYKKYHSVPFTNNHKI